MIRTQGEALDLSSPANIQFKPGADLVDHTDRIVAVEVRAGGTLGVIDVTVPTGALTTPFTFIAPFAMSLRDMTVRALAAQTSGTIRLRRGTTVMGPTVISAVSGNVTRTASFVNAETEIAAGETLNLLASHDPVTCVVTLTGIRT